MFTSKNTVLTENLDKLRVIQGLIFGVTGALTAEVLLKSFVREEHLFPPLGRFITCALALYTIHRFSVATFRLYKPSMKDVGTISLVMMLSIALLGIGRVLSMSVSSYLGNTQHLVGISPDSFEFGIPFATGALLLQAIFSFQFGLVFSLSFATIVALYSPTNPIFFAFVLVTSLVACLSISSFRSRSAYLRAGLRISYLSLPFAIASAFMDPSLSSGDLAIRAIATLSGGILSAIVAAGLIPIIEHLGGYVTDLRLIEMATLDHPILKELSVQCPGTWNHSMVMGMMVEAAASSINANPVLARVGSYFHDIGKIKKPLYFVENQAGQENRHDKLSSSMSALIIRSHVKDGIELAYQHRLPQKIVDMIPQHHGTSRIEYFYDKACKEAEEAGEDPSLVDVNLYSYPGPKPQTKEAGILMLADGIEAATRTLSDPSYDRIQGLVQKMINKVFASGELDECELTLKDLHSIAKSFTRVLSGIYHQRIAYAEPAEKTKVSEEEDSSPAEMESRSSAKYKKGESAEPKDKEPHKEDLKRLGL